MARSFLDAISVNKRKLGQKLLRSPLHPLYTKLAREPQVREYRRFRAELDRMKPPAAWFHSQMDSWTYRPVVSLLTPVRNPNLKWLEKVVESVSSQIYPNWELCICDDASDPQWIPPQSFYGDPRIRFALSDTRLGISGALNGALQMATGEYVGGLDHDDFLSNDALFRVVEALQQDKFDLLYSDEEYVDERGDPIRPNFKPDWSPELLSNCMYIGHLVVVSRAMMNTVGGFRGEFDGAQDYDLALRITDGNVRVAHLPHILYHWRQHRHSIASSSAAKPWAHDAGRRAVEDMVRRRGWNAEVAEAKIPTRYHVVRKPGDTANVSIIRAAGKNAAASRSPGTYFVFLASGVKPVSPDWLDRLVAQAQRTEVGAVGAKLIYPDGSIQHSGLAVGILGGGGNPGRGLYQSDYWRWFDYTRNVTAVSSECMAIRKDVLDRIGGFNEDLTPEEADMDLCLRLREAGYEVIFEQQAVLVNHEPRQPSKDDHFRQTSDPYYTRYLRTDREDLSLRWPTQNAAAEF
jgi:GT2 family glycosyltransferase